MPDPTRRALACRRRLDVQSAGQGSTPRNKARHRRLRASHATPEPTRRRRRQAVYNAGQGSIRLYVVLSVR